MKWCSGFANAITSNYSKKDFCPPIDTALFSAILSDYDVTKADSVAELRATLELLKENVTVESNTSFDPSGTSGFQDDSSIQDSSNRAHSWHGDLLSEETSLSSLSRSLKTIGINRDDETEAHNFNGSTEMSNDAGLEELSPGEKVTMLTEMFPTVKGFDIGYVLKKVDNRFGKAVEELLNYVFFEEEENDTGEQIIKKSIDGFAEPNHSRERKARTKRKRQTRRASHTPKTDLDPLENSLTTPRSRWDRTKEEIEFITKRTYLSHETVSSIYHKSGASLSLAIAKICTLGDSNPVLSATSHTVLQAHISELALDFPTIPLSQTTGLIYLTHPSTASAHELARILAISISSALQIAPHYLPRPPSPPSPKESVAVFPRPVSLSTPAQLASAREVAIAQASAAYRKSKSKPLMAGAASYYSSVAREASSALRLHEAAAAETLVVSQSKAGEVDLHGVNVQDAVRIVKDRVEAWWTNGASEWARAGKARGPGLRIVTGIGRHSEGKKGKLGPAVGGMLLREGWKVEMGEGVVVVVGRMRK